MGTYTFDGYAQHLAGAGRRLNPKLKSTMQRAGLNIRDDWRDRATKLNRKHAPEYAGHILMGRVIVVDGMVAVTVQPYGQGQGNLGQVLERGSIYSKAQNSDVAAMNAEAPRLAEWLGKIAADEIR